MASRSEAAKKAAATRARKKRERLKRFGGNPSHTTKVGRSRAPAKKGQTAAERKTAARRAQDRADANSAFPGLVRGARKVFLRIA